MPIAFSIVGMVLLIVGGEFLVRGSAALATAARISPLVIGLTVVAFGTSAPELAVSLQSAWSGDVNLAIGNIVGSNIANVLLILGTSALIVPLVVSSQLVRIDVPFMICASVAMLLLGLDGVVSRLDGAFLFTTLIIYTIWLIRKSRFESALVQEQFADEFSQPPKQTLLQLLYHIGLIALGTVLLAFGARTLVGGATEIARLLRVDELIIGLTVVAIGTSLPEVVTSVMASIRGERDIAVGNVVGSNLFNILCVLGLTSIVAPQGVNVTPAALRFDIPVMIAVAVACLPIFCSGNRIERWEGAMFFGYYIVYLCYVCLAAAELSAARTLGKVMIYFVLPLTFATLAALTARAIHQRFRRDPAA